MLGDNLYFLKKNMNSFINFLEKKIKIKNNDLVYQINFKIIKYRQNGEYT
jgi:hypothetical protein